MLFLPWSISSVATRAAALAIPIADNQQIQDIKLMMPRTGNISGRVFDSDGEPMGHARVQAMEAFYERWPKASLHVECGPDKRSG